MDSKPKDVPSVAVEANTEKASTGDCDAQLKDYSDFVDEYIALLKKASAGDMSAMQRYPALMKRLRAVEKASRVSTKTIKLMRSVGRSTTKSPIACPKRRWK